MTPFSILSARLQSDTPVCGVPIEPYVLVRRADGTTVTAGMCVCMYLRHIMQSPLKVFVIRR